LSASRPKKDTLEATDPFGCGRNLGLTRITGKLRSVSKMAWTQVFIPGSGVRSTLRLRYHQHFFLRVAVRVVLSVVLGCAFIECFYIADKIKPYSAFRDRLTDVLTFPGFVIAHFFKLVSTHTVGVSDDSWWAFFLGNSFFYAVIFYFILNVLHLPPRVREL
jgi:hypothetical protein